MAVEQLRGQPGVEFAEPNFLVKHAQVTSNDPRFSEQWALRNAGQSGGAPGSDVRAGAAWQQTVGSYSTVVAVVDSGIDFTHPDLRAHEVFNLKLPAEVVVLSACQTGIGSSARGYVEQADGLGMQRIRTCTHLESSNCCYDVSIYSPSHEREEIGRPPESLLLSRRPSRIQPGCSYCPNLFLYSMESRKALTISALMKLPLNSLSLSSQKL